MFVVQPVFSWSSVGRVNFIVFPSALRTMSNTASKAGACVEHPGATHSTKFRCSSCCKRLGYFESNNMLALHPLEY